MNLHPGLVFLAGLVVIIVGAELVLRGAARLAAMLKLEPFMIGMTVVAVGTSAPELAIGMTAVLEGKGTLAVANVAGTNAFNILFILGMTAAIRPLPLQRQSIKLDVPVMMAAAIGLLVMSLDGRLSRLDGLLLVSAGIAYAIALVRLGRRESARVREQLVREHGPAASERGGGASRGWWYGLVLIAGIALTIFGADLLVVGATKLAEVLGVSDAIIGLTIVAVGTSAPELATTIVATLKNERDVAVGNLIGSSVSNIFLILGLTSVAAPDGVDVARDVLWFDLPLGAGVALACYPVFRSGQLVSRLEGCLFVSVYVVYFATLVLLRT